MDLLLPKRIDGKQASILRDTRQITIIGANGSGKSRFCNQLISECGDKAYRISALKALFPIQNNEQPLPGSIDAMFNRMNEASHHVKNSADTEFDKLTYTDCEKTNITTDESGNSTSEEVYEDGTGYFTLKDGKLLWDGASEEDCKLCVFEA